MAYRQLSLQDVPTTHPVCAFSEFWRSAAAGDNLVSWSAFDPVEHAPVLPWILLLKRESGADPGVSSSWRYAVCGSGCIQLFGRNSQGKTFGDGLPPDALAERQAEIDRLVVGSGPLYSHTHVPIEGRDFMQVVRGAFPFTANGPVVDRIVFVIAGEEERMPEGQVSRSAQEFGAMGLAQKR